MSSRCERRFVGAGTARPNFSMLTVRSLKLLAIPAALVVTMACAGVVHGQSSVGGHQARSEGQRIYEKANCVGCHKWHGNGGGGYGGAALSLRETQLDRDQIIEVVHCGRPGTGMPYHDRTAYKDFSCFGGASAETFGPDMPAAAANFLRPKEIETVVDYVLQHIKGKGAPTYQDCTDFFGDGARACGVYKSETGAASQGQPAAVEK